jgi:hypothetical protein
MNGYTFSRVPDVRPFSTLDHKPSPQTFLRVTSATFGHYLENTGTTDLVYMEVFRADRFEEVSFGLVSTQSD